MRIAINTLAMKRELYGVGNYIKNLVSMLSALDRENSYVLFASRDNVCHLQGLGPNFEVGLAPHNLPLRVCWEQTLLPLRLRQERIDVYHGPTFVTPFVKTCAQVVTIHDMTFHTMPQRHTFAKQLYFRNVIPAAIRRSDMAIAVSESTKRDILRLVKTDADKIAVVHLGVNARFLSSNGIEELAAVRMKYGIPRQFILFVGLIEPRKNLPGLVEAYQAVCSTSPYDLVLAGSLGWDYAALLKKIADSPVRHQIHMPGYIADADLPALYRAAAVFVYPSFYEGFGLPVLEAMASGTPVISSATSSLPELVGNAGILVEPSDTNDLASALSRVMEDGSLRQRMSEDGIERAKLFTWQKTASETLDVYKRVAG
jgi:glycosyltransferase involved in cell wall biosynthesis